MRPAVETQRGRFALGIRPAGEVAGKQQRADARDVGLEGQRQQIELQLDVFVEGLRHADRHGHIGRRDGRGLHRNLQPALDLADVLACSRRAARDRTRSNSLRRRERLPVSESRMLRSRLRRAARCSTVLPSPNMRSNTTCGFSSIGSGCGRRGPGDRVGVGAAVAFAAVARIRARIFDRELHGRHQVVLADLLRDDLIDRGARVHVRAGRLLGLVRAQERRRHPVVGAGRARRRFGRAGMQAAQDHRHVFPERLQRLAVERKLEVQRAFLVREPSSRAPCRGGTKQPTNRGFGWPPSAPAPSRPAPSLRETAAPASRRRRAERSGGKCVSS